MQYRGMLDVYAYPYRDLAFALPGLPFIAIGAIMAFRPEWAEAVFRRPIRERYIFRWALFLFTIFWTVAAIASFLADAKAAARSPRPDTCRDIPSRSENSDATGVEGDGLKPFKTELSPINCTANIGYGQSKNTSSASNPIRVGPPVRASTGHRDSTSSTLLVFIAGSGA